MAFSDFIVSKDSGVKDYFGMFVCFVGFGFDEFMVEFKVVNDDYFYIMVEVLVDRFVEAFAELFYERVRKDDWGYVKDEFFNCEDLFKVKY